MKLLKRIVLALALVATVGVGYKLAHAADCNANAVVYCGASTKAQLANIVNNTGDTAQGGSHSAAELQQVYYNEGRGITKTGATAIDSSSTTIGTVTSSGNVIVGGNVVAHNVWSSGRSFLPNSVHDGSLWMRPTSVSFLSSSLPAFVNMAGGSFHWAIIQACGNPVKQIAAPFGEIFKRVVDKTVDPNTNFAADDQAHAVPVSTGDILIYQVNITNQGTSTMTGVNMTDDLPAGVELVSNPSTVHITDTFPDIAPGGSFQDTITVKVTQTNAGFITNQACFTANGNQSGCDTAVVKITTKPPCTVNCKPPCVTNCKPPCTVNCKPPCVTNCKPPCAVNCNHKPTPPVGGGTLPQTGAEDAFGGLFGLSALGYVTKDWLRSKRQLLKALKQR